VGAAGVVPADVRARLRGLRLVANLATASGGLGQHASRQRGAGLEFSQYRSYEPGDEPRRIDWKLYARSDRWFVREAERDSALRVCVLIDATASMAQADLARPAWSKLDAARALAACVFELALRQGDRFGFAAVSGAGLDFVPPAAGSRQRDQCLLRLARLAPGGSWPPETALRPLLERIGTDTLVFAISDGFDDAWAALLERLARARREVLSVQVLGADERDFPFRGGHRFRDPESGAELQLDAPSARAAFIARFAQARQRLAARLSAVGVRHVEYVLDQDLDAPLRRFFAVRASERAAP
jgi:uncharacterized protein (DUF58 family)